MFSQIFRNLTQSLLCVYSARNLVWHALAIALTIVLVLTGLDWLYYTWTRSEILHPIVWAAGIGGFFVPVIVPFALYITGEVLGDERLLKAGISVAQAVIIALIVAALYKAFTGRIEPEFIFSIGDTDISRNFQFGLLKHGVFWGWPSSHAAVAFAGAAALSLSIRVRWVQALAFLYALVIALGASVGFHWLSDVAAGAIIGILIGIVVAKGVITKAGPS